MKSTRKKAAEAIKEERRMRELAKESCYEPDYMVEKIWEYIYETYQADTIPILGECLIVNRWARTTFDKKCEVYENVKEAASFLMEHKNVRIERHMYEQKLSSYIGVASLGLGQKQSDMSATVNIKFTGEDNMMD